MGGRSGFTPAAAAPKACHVYRLAPDTGQVSIVADDFQRPNGLAFSIDERQPYIADSRSKHIRLFEVIETGTLSGGHVFATCDAGTVDGIRLDDAGRIWAAAHDEVHCFDPDGSLIGKLKLEQRPTLGAVVPEDADA